MEGREGSTLVALGITTATMPLPLLGGCSPMASWYKWQRACQSCCDIGVSMVFTWEALACPAPGTSGSLWLSATTHLPRLQLPGTSKST